ncbi:hypothetical protein Tco_1070320 [Tanacetum coccineum]|uniref:Uncharacterized protein n=1 Tax=Tanacetum coccineum TaxID=301880 RepID=A0ABQ5HL47_9ASTR
MYDDVNVELKDTELDNEDKGMQTWQMLHRGGKCSSSGQATTTAALATQNATTYVPTSSSSHSILTNYGSIFLNLENLQAAETRIISMLDVKVQHEVPKATTSTTAIPESTTLSAIHQRVYDLEKEVNILKNVDHNSAIRAAIKFEVPIVVKECLGPNLEDSLHKVIRKQTAEFIREHCSCSGCHRCTQTTTANLEKHCRHSQDQD